MQVHVLLLASGPLVLRACTEDNLMARKRVGKKKGSGIKRPRKPPLHVLSDFGTVGNSPIAKRTGNDRKIVSKGDYGRK